MTDHQADIYAAMEVFIMNQYLGHDSQLYGMELHRLVGGKGDNMRLLEVHNGNGIDMTVSLDRAADISRLRYRGINMSYMSPCGYVGPAYYQAAGRGFFKSFTAGFLTTCGLQAVGSPCVDAGDELPMHGSVANFPCENAYWYEDEEKKDLVVKTTVTDETIFDRKLKLNREIRVNTAENIFSVTDIIENEGDTEEPLEILYHMNMGYPLLDEDSKVKICSYEVVPRDRCAALGIDSCTVMEKPQAHYEEQCFYHKFDKKGKASIYQPKLNMGLEIEFDPEDLDGFTEWKMMGIRDYVLGLECGNCYPDGRDVMRKTGMLKFISPGEKKKYSFTVKMMDCQ